MVQEDTDVVAPSSSMSSMERTTLMLPTAALVSAEMGMQLNFAGMQKEFSLTIVARP